MFRCKKCNQLSRSGEPSMLVVVATRAKVYSSREFAMRKGKGLTQKWIADPGGTGIEIVREEIRHEGCAGIAVP